MKINIFPNDGVIRYCRSKKISFDENTWVYWWARDGESGDISKENIPTDAVIFEPPIEIKCG